MQFIERDGDKRELFFTGAGNNGIDFEPLHLDALKKFRSSGDLHVQMRSVSVREMTDSGPELHTGDCGIDLSGMPPGFRTVGLVNGGWLPAELLQAHLLLPDRNVLSQIPLLPSSRDYTHLFGRGTRKISPILSAFEGIRRAIPTNKEFRAACNSEATKLRTNAPGFEVTSTSALLLNEMFEMLHNFREGHDLHTKFLSRVIPRLAKHIRGESLESEDLQFRELAENYKVPKKSFLFLLVLDCLYDHGPVKKIHQLAGRRVFKPSLSPNAGDLHNALADVFLLDALLKIIGMLPKHTVAACTNDAGLAQAWVMLRPRLLTADDKAARYAISLDSVGARMPDSRRESLRGS